MNKKEEEIPDSIFLCSLHIFQVCERTVADVSFNLCREIVLHCVSHSYSLTSIKSNR